jgi:hypothetical protein
MNKKHFLLALFLFCCALFFDVSIIAFSFFALALGIIAVGFFAYS